MARQPNWTDDELFTLQSAIDGGLTNQQIAKQMSRGLASVQVAAYRFFGGNPNYRKQQTKHKHLREPVMRYFVNHTAEETMKRFKITAREFKSITTVSYKMPELKHLRKDTRLHSPWSLKQTLLLLRSSGIKPRSWIEKKVKRGYGNTVVKERLEKLGLSSRTLNGMTLSSYRAVFNKEPRKYIDTKAGPGRGKYSPTYFKIIPWFQVDRDIKEKYVATKNEPFANATAIMAMFQRWIFNGNPEESLKCL